MYTSVTVKFLSGISFYVMAKSWEYLKGTLVFSSFLVCSNRNRVLLTSDVLPSIALVVGQSSVNISPALRTRDKSTSRLASNQSLDTTRIYFLFHLIAATNYNYLLSRFTSRNHPVFR